MRTPGVSAITLAAVVFSLAALLVPPPCPAAGLGEELRISLAEGLVMLLESNLDVTIERYSPKAAESRLTSLRGAFDVEAFGSFTHEDTETPLTARSSVAAGGLESIQTETNRMRTGLEGRTPLGTQYSLEFRDSWTADTLSRFDFEYTSFAGVTLTQPLLKDFGRTANLREVRIASKDRDITVHRFRGLVTEKAAEYALAYWDLVSAREELEVRTDSVELARDLLETNRKKLSAGATSRLEVTQSEATVAARMDDVIVAKRTVRERENALKLLITGDVYSLKDSSIVPTDAPVLTTVDSDLEKSIREAVENRADYLETKAEIEKNDIRINYAENQVFPRVDVEASYGYSGLGGSFGGSLEGMEENPQWSLGVVLRYPLGNRAAEGELATARFEATQALLRLKKMEQEIIVGLDDAIKDMEANRERLQAARVATRLAEEALKAEQTKLEAGRSTSYTVLQFQEDLAMARSREVASMVDYRKSVVNYFRLKGTLLERLGVEVDENP